MMNEQTPIRTEVNYDESRRGLLFDMARQSLKTFYLSDAVCERADFIEHAERTVELAGAFAGDLLPEPAYHAALLHDVAQRLKCSEREDIKDAAADAMSRYFYNNELLEKERRYVSTILGDMKKIGGSAKAYRKKFKTPELSQGLSERDLDILSNGSAVDIIPEYLWAVEEPEIGVKRLSKVTKHTNFESIVVLAAEKIDHLQHSEYSSESKLLHDVLEAETFYAPLCEFWGLDAMAMTLKSAGARQRLKKLGYQEKINEAHKEYVQAIEFGGPEQAINQLFGEERSNRRFNIEPSLGKYPNQLAKFCELIVDIEGDENMRIVGRIKSVGSLAKKMVSGLYKDTGRLPMDIIGLTAISKDVDQLIAQLRTALNTVYDQEGRTLHLREPVSKSQPIYIQGSREYKERILRGMQGHPLLDRIEVKEDESPFQVAKFTCSMVNEAGVWTNVEMQFLTEEDRRKARHGITAHALRKSMEKRKGRGRDVTQKYIRKSERHMNGIGERKSKVSKDRLESNERTRERGKRLLSEIALRSSGIIKQ